MSLNKEIARRLEEIAEMQELTGANPFRASSNSRAAQAVSNLSEDVAELAKDRARLTAVDGIGKNVAEKIVEYIETGEMTEHRELREKVPAGLLDVLAIPGLGPKTVKAIWDTLGVTSVDQLKEAIDSGAIHDVPRLGKKTVENIKSAIAFAEQGAERTPLGLALPVAERFVERLRKVTGAERVEPAGSIRRGKESVGDIDILACGSDADALSKAFRDMPEVTQVLSAGKTKSSVRACTTEADEIEGRVMQIDLRVIPEESFGAALMYFTGSMQHNVRLRERANRMGYTLNEYGLFPLDDDAPPQQRGVKPVASRTEDDIYKALDLPWLAPEIREDQGETNLPRNKPPKLLELNDIKAELHAHTTASDGAMSIEDLAEAAKARGFHTIAVTDHSKSQVVANGLSPERLREHIDAVAEANEKIKGITILAGTEVDILGDGSLDYDDDLLAALDIVVASPHSGLKQKPKDATHRLVRAVKNPNVNILGHPTGRLINRREGMSPDIGEIARAAAANNVALEINAHWMRLDLRDTHVRAALDAGALIAIDCDVHGEGDFDNLIFGVLTGRRGWLSAERCVNTWSAKKLHRWLRKE